MKIDLNLSYPGKFQWSQHENLYFIGYAFDLTGKLYQSAGDWKTENFEDQIENVNGAFGAILFKNQEVIIWTDTAASFPIFYKKENDLFQIACQPTPTHPLELHNTEAFTNIFCTEHNTTLLKDWFSVLAGHKVSINISTKEIKIERYFNHFISIKKVRDEDFDQKFLEITQNWAQQIITFANGNPIWVPLSGGYDCRLLLSALIMAKAPNLHSYTYGKSMSPEIIMAHQVAKQLKIDWHFIPYDERAFSHFFTDTWRNYALRNHHYHALPHEQDYFALLALSEKGVLGKDFVAITGHCGEIPAGSVLKSYPIDTKEYITHKYGYSPTHFIKNIDPWDSYHQWLSENRLSKFITNSLRLFEYFGGKWMLPMWHKDFMQLFYGLEFKERWGEKAYIELAFKYYFEPLEIDFRKPKGDTISADKTIKDYIKSALPKIIVNKIKDLNMNSSVADPCNLQLLYKMLYEHMRINNLPLPPKKDGDFNRLHALYMVEMIKNSYK